MRSDPRQPLPSERGAKRTGAIGSIVPGDHAEVARDIQRIWWELRRVKRKPPAPEVPPVPGVAETSYAPVLYLECLAGAEIAPTGYSAVGDMTMIGSLVFLTVQVVIGGGGIWTPGNGTQWKIRWDALDALGNATPKAFGGTSMLGVGYANDFSASVNTPMYAKFGNSITREFFLYWDGPGTLPLPPATFNQPYVWAANDTIFQAAVIFSGTLA